LKPFKKHNLQHVQTPSKRLIGFKPNWPAPDFVQALMTTRDGGVSEAPWNSLNLGDHVGDNPEHVQANRALVAQAMQAPAIYLRQVHGAKGVVIDLHTPDHTEADVAWTSETGVACTMMVADCLPILVCHPHQKWVAAAHAGWRGLAGENGHGVVETLAATARLQGCLPKDCLVWLGPCIGPTAFEVGPEVLKAFESQIPEQSSKTFFVPTAQGKFMADLAGLAKHRLQLAGFQNLYGNDSTSSWCTYQQASKYHSHRRDAALLGSAGRMAAYIWITA
jgi:YfiH family protein